MIFYVFRIMQYSHKVIIGVLSAAAVLYILMQQLTVDPPNRQLYNSWRSCLKSKIDQHRGNANALWLAITKAVTDCDQPYVDILKIEDQANEGEIKRHIWPLRVILVVFLKENCSERRETDTGHSRSWT